MFSNARIAAGLKRALSPSVGGGREAGVREAMGMALVREGRKELAGMHTSPGKGGARTRGVTGNARRASRPLVGTNVFPASLDRTISVLDLLINKVLFRMSGRLISEPFRSTLSRFAVDNTVERLSSDVHFAPWKRVEGTIVGTTGA